MSIFLINGCTTNDVKAPFITIKEDTLIHYLGEEYFDAGATAIDNHDCDVSDILETENLVDINMYGTYEVIYTATDASGNSDTAIRQVDIVLQPKDFYAIEYQVQDSCTSGNYNYTTYIQDCACPGTLLSVGNIANFGGFSSLFTLPISGQYNQKIEIDTIKSGVSFIGSGLINRTTDTMRWTLTISDSIETDYCISTWSKNE